MVTATITIMEWAPATSSWFSGAHHSQPWRPYPGHGDFPAPASNQVLAATSRVPELCLSPGRLRASPHLSVWRPPSVGGEDSWVQLAVGILW